MLPMADGDRRGDEAEEAVLDGEDPGDVAARRAEHLQHHGVIDAPAVTRGDGAGQDQRAGEQGDRGGDADRGGDLLEDARDRVERVLDMDRGDVGELVGDARSSTASASGVVRAVAISVCGAASSVPGAKTIAKLMPSVVQSIERRLAIVAVDLAAEQVDGERVADLEAHAVREIGVERDERRALIIRRPPSAGDDARAASAAAPHRSGRARC